jgi:DNA-binding ferritin-like protein
MNFLINIEELRARARKQIEDGAVTGNYKLDRDRVVMLAERINQLGGNPEMNPAVITQVSHSEYKEGESLADMIREDLVAERIAIESYREMVSFFGLSGA